MSIFHRYSSTIHGNYRKAYLRSGLITGVLLAAYLFSRLLMGKPLESPTSYVSDAVMLVAVFLFMAFYRNSLPDKKITLKEAMLFGIGTAVIAAIFYGLMLWAVGVAFPQPFIDGPDPLVRHADPRMWADGIQPKGPRTLLTAVHEGQIVGFTGPVDLQKSGRGWFTGICTDPTFERKGIATVLFNLLMQAFVQEGAAFSTLFTGLDNPARKVYERAGMRPVRQFNLMTMKL